MKRQILALTCCTVLLSSCASHPPKNINELSPAAKVKAARINIQLGMAYLENKQNQLAKGKLLRALEIAPQLPESHYALGYYYLELKEPKKAKPYYEQASKLAPNNPHVLNSYGVFLCATGQYEQAEKAFLNAASQPKFTAVGLTYQNAGDCAYQYKDNTHAMVYFKKANEIDPRLPVPLLRLAEINFAQGKLKLAEQYLTAFNDIADPTVESLSLGVKLATAQGNKSKAASLRLQLNALQHPNID